MCFVAAGKDVLAPSVRFTSPVTLNNKIHGGDLLQWAWSTSSSWGKKTPESYSYLTEKSRKSALKSVEPGLNVKAYYPRYIILSRAQRYTTLLLERRRRLFVHKALAQTRSSHSPPSSLKFITRLHVSSRFTYMMFHSNRRQRAFLSWHKGKMKRNASTDYYFVKESTTLQYIFHNKMIASTPIVYYFYLLYPIV